MTITDVALQSLSPADSPSRALRAALAERLASHRQMARKAATRLSDALPQRRESGEPMLAGAAS